MAALEVPHLEGIGAVIRDRDAELVVAGRVPSSAWAYLETESACRVRCFIEERGMRSARDHAPRSLLATWIERLGAADLVARLATLGDGVILDTRVLMAALARSADAVGWPAQEERFASDFLDGGWAADRLAGGADGGRGSGIGPVPAREGTRWSATGCTSWSTRPGWGAEEQASQPERREVDW